MFGLPGAMLDLTPPNARIRAYFHPRINRAWPILFRFYFAFYFAWPLLFRTSDQYEIDLLLECGGRLWAFQIKLTAAPSPADLETLGKKAELVGAHGHFLISRTSQPLVSERRGSLNLKTCLEFIFRL